MKNENKIKAFFKKYWGYFAAFAAGILAYLGMDRARGTRVESNLANLRGKLEEYRLLVERLEHLNRELEHEVGDLKQTNTRLGVSIDELREVADEGKRDIERASATAVGLRESIETAGDDIDSLQDIDRRLKAESDRVNEGIARLRALIENNEKAPDRD